ncbi:MAG: lysine--tRNA ligase [Clostridia bacterium]|nr:lysine--tRNA ligase [Clostridia bacterium]
MHWSEKIAREIIRKKPNKETYTCAAGISPSGSVHIGNFRDLATGYLVCRSLEKLGKRCRFIFSWDEYDRLRKIPQNVKKLFYSDVEWNNMTEDERKKAPCDFDKYLGMPYAMVPDPFGCCESYGRHFEKQFEDSYTAFDIPTEFIYQKSQYLSGRYKDDVIYALSRRKEIYDIIQSFKTQDASDAERENYYPASIYCHKCGKDNTTITSLDDNFVAEYTCTCGHHGIFDFHKDYNCKLQWKVDWPMRWRAEGVDFEPGGKDHASPNGSYDVGKEISKKIFDYDAPYFAGYEFIGIKGSVGKMSGSTGLNLTPDVLLKMYQPEVIMWLYSKTEPQKAFDFCFDEEILRQYSEFDKVVGKYYSGKANSVEKDILDVFLAGKPKLELVPMQSLVNFGPVVNWDEDTLEKLFVRTGDNFTKEQFHERLIKAKNWLLLCAPHLLIQLEKQRNQTFYDTLSDEEKREVKILHDKLKAEDYTLDELKTMLYAIVTDVFGDIDMEDKKQKQARFFEIIYRLLINKSAGPRLFLFLYAVDKNTYIDLLDF